MFGSTKGNEDTWTYYPGKDTIFHRHIHVGDFWKPKRNFTITETVGEHSYDSMLKEGARFTYLNEPLDNNVSENSYIVYDSNYTVSKENILKLISSCPNLYSLGRFGQWDYSNMDICIKQSIELSKKISFKH